MKRCVLSAALRIGAPRKIGRFHEGPGQIFVAAFLVVLSFLFAVGQALRIHRPAIAGKVAGVGESLDPAHFHGDCQS